MKDYLETINKLHDHLNSVIGPDGLELPDGVESADSKQLIYNAIQTPDGTIIESRGRHDYVTHTDANGKEYMIDGGCEYVRCSANGDEVMLQKYLSMDHSENRKYVTWGTYGINGDQPLRYIPVAQMDDGHLDAVIKMSRVYPYIREVMRDEVEARAVGKCEQETE